MSAKARKRHTRKSRRLHNARTRSKKRIVRHKCRKGRTGTAHSKTNKPKRSIHYVHGYALVMESARLHATRGES